MDNRIAALCGFLDESRSVYHAHNALVKELEANGYRCLSATDPWDLVPGGKYYATRGGTALIAFRIPHEKPRGFMMSASHSDRPTFKLKEHPELKGAYTRLAVERYGGMIISPWLDRPLSLAGRVMVETENGVEARLVDIDRDLLLIPNVAIHMNRQVNESNSWNPAVDVMPLLGGQDAAGKLEALLEEQAGGRILGSDLFLYVREKAKVWGMDNEYLSGAALDDLTCAWCCTQGFLKAEDCGSISVLCVFDNEEVGSYSAQGAASTMLSNVLGRISSSLGVDQRQLLAQSFMVSADNGHAMHPNHPELADPANAPLMGGGVTIKFTANLRYCTDGLSAAVFRKICEKAGVPTQTYCNRPDIAGGSTLGSISLGKVSVPTVDIGLAQLAMHSCYETAAVADAIAMEEAMTAYFGTSLEYQGSSILVK